MEKKPLVLCDTNAGELLYGAFNKKELVQIKNDLANLHLIHLTQETGECFTQLMLNYTLSHRLSLPDGLIAATALTEKISLYTHNLKDFKYISDLRLKER